MIKLKNVTILHCLNAAIVSWLAGWLVMSYPIFPWN